MPRNLLLVGCIALSAFLVGCGGSNEAYRPDMTPPDKKPEIQMSSSAGGQSGGSASGVRSGSQPKGE